MSSGSNLNFEESPGEKESLVNLIKLCVGALSVQDLEHWQRSRFEDMPPFHLTRMRPRRHEEILNGGSLYWVIKGFVQARQRIIGLDYRICEDGIRRCAIEFDGKIIRTQPQPRRPFQGWRYLSSADSPADLPSSKNGGGNLPGHIEAHLNLMGVVPPPPR